MVAPDGRADARLLRRGGRERPPLLALPRRPLRPDRRRPAMVRARGVRMSAGAGSAHPNSQRSCRRKKPTMAFLACSPSKQETPRRKPMTLVAKLVGAGIELAAASLAPI